MTPLGGALLVAARGVPVLPLWGVSGARCRCRLGADCPHPGKHPMTRKGASIRETDVRAWWSRAPWANVGARTGAVRASGAGVLVVDIDPRHFGDESWARLAEHQALPDTWETITGSRGRHLWFSYDPRATGPVPCSVGHLGAGVDVRADGGLVVVPPSGHVSGGRYGWEVSSSPEDGVPLTAAPAWLLGAILGARVARARRGGGGVGEGARGEVIPAGQRNATLYRLACAWRAKGLEESAILAALVDANALRCDPPLADGELVAVARSAASRAPGLSPDYAARAERSARSAALAELGRYAFRERVEHYTCAHEVPDDPEGGVQW